MRRLFVLIALAAALAPAAPPQAKKRVAVMNFDYATVRGQVSAIFGTDEDIGKGIADLIVEKLVQSGRYSVIERKALDKVMAEQNFSNSDRADDRTGAKLARILGVDAIIMGSITQFGRDDKSSGIGGGAVSRVTDRFGIGGIRRTSAKAVVGISARMVQTDTAEIVLAAKGLGESKRSGTSLAGAGGGDVAAGGRAGMKSANFSNTIIGEAVDAAVVQLCYQLDEGSSRLPARVVVISGLVADATGGTLVLNVGSRAGVRVGDQLQVLRKGRPIRDPATGKVLRSLDAPIGQVVITEVDEASSVGTFSGTLNPKVGDVVKNK